jgi:hypothetical protein
MSDTAERAAPWLLLTFTLPAARATERVEVWRKLRKYGALQLQSAGYVLPQSATNQERLEWLATTIRKYKGHAGVAHVLYFDYISDHDLRAQFTGAREREYTGLIKELKKAKPGASARTLQTLRRRFRDSAEIDFFGSPMREQVEELLRRLESPRSEEQKVRALKLKEYAGRTWMTRPRPGIDRVACTWFIRRLIDPEAKVLFATNPSLDPEVIPFDMFNVAGFGHEGDRCSLETFVHRFRISDPCLVRIAEAVHDADFHDEKFGRVEAIGIDRVLNGWAVQGLSDEEILTRGTELIEGLYHALK